MNFFSAVLLGILQGLTEFLPVSSSGHLVLVQSLIPNFSQPGILFDVMLHFGTLVAILFYFRKKIRQYLNLKYLYILAVGTVPAVIVGLLFKDQIEILFRSTRLVGFALLLTGIMNLLTDKQKAESRNLPAGKAGLKARSSLLIGIAQAVAIIPGISRSGSTIFAGVTQGLKRKEAAEFSFLLSIPAVLGANVLEIYNHGFENIQNPASYFAGFVAAAIFGYLAIKLVYQLLAGKKFKYFAYYCFVVGILVLVF